jgi:hypothetical protein
MSISCLGGKNFNKNADISDGATNPGLVNELRIIKISGHQLRMD